MSVPERCIFIANNPQQANAAEVKGGYVTLLNETFYRIHYYDAIPPFFMSIVSAADHWLFVASTGGLSAGRVSAENALFPYYSSDILTENSEHTGSKSILLATHGDRTALWEPFSSRYEGAYSIERNLYKNLPGTALVFEEINLDLGLIYRYAWRTSNEFGFVKTSWVSNIGSAGCTVELVDGLQNLLPSNVNVGVQLSMSVLLDAYKRSELVPHTGLGIFALSSILSDLAEPSESLRATTVWSLGMDDADVLLSTEQLDKFRRGQGIVQETEIRGKRCAYFIHSTFSLEANAVRSWHFVADLNQDSAAIARHIKALEGDREALAQQVEADIEANTDKLIRIVGSADGLQVSGDQPGTAHHFANVMFNVMRGGIFANQYHIDADDFCEFVSVHYPPLINECAQFFERLPTRILYSDLVELAASTGSPDLTRLAYSYLPLTFSRRHGDPSRPWNRFAINIKKLDGSQNLDYEGNWRDIFQNWEALAYSYPAFIDGMITTFLNATTVDGYNPYRITRSGIDWEVPEPSNPWANIGYWSDHQIIYLQKLMEVSNRFYPGRLSASLDRSLFSYANVPYRIKPYANLIVDHYNTIEFNWALEKQIKARVHEYGTDGKLVTDQNGEIYHATLAEKLLTLLLAKLSNLVPEGGIWMNTQRPEWNDANNALVGKGLSVVTLGYLRRYIAFCKTLFEASPVDSVSINCDVQAFYQGVLTALESHESSLSGSFDDQQRRKVMDALGQAGSDYRWHYYEHGLSGEQQPLATDDILAFLTLAQRYVEHSLRANKRPDSLYHAYNLLSLDDGRASIRYMYEMLEGQVAILSSGMLSDDEALALLQTMRQSALFRTDQHSYILYPKRELPGFLQKNAIKADQVEGLSLISTLVANNDQRLITRDINGTYHFNGTIRNAKDVRRILDAMKQQEEYAELATAYSERILALFEAVFDHAAFTGRSGTFFAYEGLGSIYWHMVSKLLLAVQESVVTSKNETVQRVLIERYEDVRQGLGFNKTPDHYGAFPTDPYSHTPDGQGAKQPGMTGMVKEEILTRLAEVGLVIENGKLIFDPLLFRQQELVAAPTTFNYIDVAGQLGEMALDAGSLAYTFCQVPVIVQRLGSQSITAVLSDGSMHTINGLALDADMSAHIFQRDGVVRELRVSIA